MSKFVVCAACGARIRADRARCLRCNEPLVAAHQVPRWRTLYSDRRMVLSAVGSLAGLMVIALLLGRRGGSAPEDTQHRGPAANPQVAAGRAPAASQQDVARSPESFIDLARAGAAAFGNSDFQGAKRQYEAALAKNPNDPEALNNLGQTLARMGDLAGAVARFERAIQLLPDKWAYHFNLAHVSGRLSQWERAVAEYREALRLFPDDHATQFNLAMALHKKQDDAAAIPEFEKAIELAPDEASFHIALGNSFQKVGKLAEAKREFELYLEMEPSAPDAAQMSAHIEALTRAGAGSATANASPAGGTPALP